MFVERMNDCVCVIMCQALGPKYLRAQAEVLQESDQGFLPGQAWPPICSEGAGSSPGQA